MQTYLLHSRRSWTPRAPDHPLDLRFSFEQPRCPFPIRFTGNFRESRLQIDSENFLVKLRQDAGNNEILPNGRRNFIDEPNQERSEDIGGNDVRRLPCGPDLAAQRILRVIDVGAIQCRIFLRSRNRLLIDIKAAHRLITEFGRRD